MHQLKKYTRYELIFVFLLKSTCEYVVLLQNKEVQKTLGPITEPNVYQLPKRVIAQEKTIKTKAEYELILSPLGK